MKLGILYLIEIDLIAFLIFCFVSNLMFETFDKKLRLGFIKLTFLKILRFMFLGSTKIGIFKSALLKTKNH